MKLDNIMNIIKDSLNYYDTNNLKYSHIMKKVKYIKYYMEDDTEMYICHFYDKDKKLIFKSSIEFIGRYHKQSNIWNWGWAYSMMSKPLINTSKNIFLYAFDLYTDTISNILIKQQLLTSRLYISNNIQIETFCSIASYLTKTELIVDVPWVPIDKTAKPYFIEYDRKKFNGVYLFIHNPPQVNNN